MLESRFQLNAPACIAEAVEGDLIVINLDSGRYFNMRGESVGSWLALTQGISPSELIDANHWTSEQIIRFNAYVQCLVDEHLLVPIQNVVETPSQPPSIAVQSVQNCFHIDVFTDMQEMLMLDPIHDASVEKGWPHQP